HPGRDDEHARDAEVDQRRHTENTVGQKPEHARHAVAHLPRQERRREGDDLDCDRDIEELDVAKLHRREPAQAAAADERQRDSDHDRKREHHQATSSTPAGGAWLGWSPSARRTDSSAATTFGSNWWPAMRRSSCTASATVVPRR